MNNILQTFTRIRSNDLDELFNPNLKSKKMKIYLGPKFEKTYLTYREATCMLLLLRGKTIYSIADFLGLSYRTVEHYINNIKAKVGCTNRSELIRTIYFTDFVDNAYILCRNEVKQ